MLKSRVAGFLDSEETIEKTQRVGDAPANIEYDINYITHPNFESGERVLLAIRRAVEACVLTGGNPLNLEVLGGFGRLGMVDLVDGSSRDIFLEPGEIVDVWPGTAYWYENLGGYDNELIVRDTCIGFDPTNEPTLDEYLSTMFPTIGPLDHTS